jgi:hypothetical protein
MEVVLQWWEALIYVCVILLLGFLIGHYLGRRMNEEVGTSYWRTAYFNLRDYQRELDRAEEEIYQDALNKKIAEGK